MQVVALLLTFGICKLLGHTESHSTCSIDVSSVILVGSACASEEKKGKPCRLDESHSCYKARAQFAHDNSVRTVCLDMVVFSSGKCMALKVQLPSALLDILNAYAHIVTYGMYIKLINYMYNIYDICI